MAKTPELTPIPTPKGFLVSVPKTLSETGSRQRRYFPLESDAEKFAASLRGRWSRGIRGGLLKVADALDAESAMAILKPTGLTLTEAAKAILAQFEAAGSSETYRDRYLRAVTEGEGRWSSRYSLDMGKVPDWIGTDVMGSQCAVLSPALLRAAVMSNGAKAESTIQARMRYVQAILNHKPRYRKASKIEIMTDNQCRQMLHASETKDERRVVALLLFAGIRPSAEDGEITRIDWSFFGKTEIYLPDDVTKTGSDRHIPITPRLKRLIKGHAKSGPVIPANWRRVYRRLRQAAGLTTEQDITRHTFASHFLAAFGEKATKSAMGHTAGSDTLFRHYRRAVLEEDGRAYFGDLPRKEMIDRAKKKHSDSQEVYRFETGKPQAE